MPRVLVVVHGQSLCSTKCVSAGGDFNICTRETHHLPLLPKQNQDEDPLFPSCILLTLPGVVAALVVVVIFISSR